MGFEYRFQSGKLYGVADVNNIVSNFTSAGVSTYSDLNGISGALAAAGVENAANSCKVISSNGQLKIMPGVAFFSDGSVITVDSGGVLLEPLQYIYMKKDAVAGTGKPVSSTTAPGVHDIPLAEYENGVLKDTREYAKSKIAGFGGNVNEKVIHHAHWNSSSAATKIAEFTLKHDCNFICLFDDAENVNDKRFLAWAKAEGTDGLFKYWGLFIPEDGSEQVSYFGSDCVYLEKSLNVNNNTFYFKKNGYTMELWYIGGPRDIEMQIYFC